MNPTTNFPAGALLQNADALFGIFSVSDEDVEAIESSVGMGCGAWDEVAPKELIAAAWNRLRLPRDLKPTPTTSTSTEAEK